MEVRFDFSISRSILSVVVFPILLKVMEKQQRKQLTVTNVSKVLLNQKVCTSFESLRYYSSQSSFHSLYVCLCFYLCTAPSAQNHS